MPALHEGEAFEVKITSPYVLRGHPRAAYEAFSTRQQRRLRLKDPKDLLMRVFEQPRDAAYCVEFVLRAYATHSDVHIVLEGVPDRSGTRPHEAGGAVAVVRDAIQHPHHHPLPTRAQSPPPIPNVCVLS